MSVLKAAQIQNLAGSPIVNSTGSILQVVQAVKTNTSSVGITANTWNENDSLFRISITPSSNTNKILSIIIQ